ncbi:unnamed protein product [Orchesella dallaii]|uniref:Uncharacterized protein n=1 Tax=Orchesella dallaii TaxID=48710 RepID=A0ABP1PQ65_9HEXA
MIKSSCSITGFGIAHETSEMEKKSYEERTPLLPLLLPEFPFPSIKSTLLDLPTLLLQLGKVFDPAYPGITISDFPLNYDFIRERCSSGELYHESKDSDSGVREVYVGVHLAVTDADFGISADYLLKEGVDLQISNLDLTLRVEELLMRFPEYFTIKNGQSSEALELTIDIASQIMEIWNEVDENGLSFERKYEESVQNAINNHLSGNQWTRKSEQSLVNVLSNVRSIEEGFLLNNELVKIIIINE